MKKEAIEKGYKVKVGRFPFRNLGKSHAIGDIVGEVKIVADAEYDEVLGAHIVGPNATELIAELALAIQCEITAEEIGRTIHSHPTLPEAIMEAAHDVHDEAIHLPPKK